MLPSVSELKEIGSLNHEGSGFLSLFKYKYSIFFILICFISTNLIIHTNLLSFYRLIKQKNDYTFRTKVYKDEIDKYSLLGYHVWDVYNTLNSRKELSQDEKRKSGIG